MPVLSNLLLNASLLSPRPGHLILRLRALRHTLAMATGKAPGSHVKHCYLPGTSWALKPRPHPSEVGCRHPIPLVRHSAWRGGSGLAFLIARSVRGIGVSFSAHLESTPKFFGQHPHSYLHFELVVNRRPSTALHRKLLMY